MAMIVLWFVSRLAGKSHYTLRVSWSTEFLDLSSTCVFALVGDLFMSSVIYQEPVGENIFWRWALVFPAVLLFRKLSRHLLNRLGLWRLDVLLIGNTELSERARLALTAERGMGYNIVGQICPNEVATYHTAADWHGVMRSFGAGVVAVAGGSCQMEAESRLLSSLNFLGIPLIFVPAVSALSVVQCRQQHVYRHDALLLSYQSRLNEPASRYLKVAMDYFLAGVLCLLISPMFFIIMIAVRMDGGPAFYRQSRIGIGGRSFRCLKFRSMRVDADDALKDLLLRDPAAAGEWAKTRKLVNDPRVTWVGRILRRTSCDELPQLLNVLRGEMSLVGPRPVVASELTMYGQSARYYTQMKPGITGLWQTSGRSDVSYEDRVRLDVWYALNWRLRHDLAILVMTVFVVFSRKGAV